MHAVFGSLWLVLNYYITYYTLRSNGIKLVIKLVRERNRLLCLRSFAALLTFRCWFASSW